MGFFKVTRELALKVLKLIDSPGGLFHRAGSQRDNTFCVQQAVSLATGNPHHQDQPTDCVMPWIVQLGIRLNDDPNWVSAESRAAGLREFAVAELGSVNLRETTVRKILSDKANVVWGEGQFDTNSHQGEYVERAGLDGEEGLKSLVQMIIETLQELNCQGCDYLCIADRDKYVIEDEFEGEVPRIQPVTPDQRARAWVADDAAWKENKYPG
jgi:hypothetical protein